MYERLKAQLINGISTSISRTLAKPHKAIVTALACAALGVILTAIIASAETLSGTATTGAVVLGLALTVVLSDLL